MYISFDISTSLALQVPKEVENFKEQEILGLSHCFSSWNWLNYEKPSKNGCYTLSVPMLRVRASAERYHIYPFIPQYHSYSLCKQTYHSIRNKHIYLCITSVFTSVHWYSLVHSFIKPSSIRRLNSNKEGYKLFNQPWVFLWITISSLDPSRLGASS